MDVYNWQNRVGIFDACKHMVARLLMFIHDVYPDVYPSMMFTSQSCLSINDMYPWCWSMMCIHNFYRLMMFDQWCWSMMFINPWRLSIYDVYQSTMFGLRSEPKLLDYLAVKLLFLGDLGNVFVFCFFNLIQFNFVNRSKNGSWRKRVVLHFCLPYHISLDGVFFETLFFIYSSFGQQSPT